MEAAIDRGSVESFDLTSDDAYDELSLNALWES